MHIAMIAGEYPPRWGGIGSVVFHLAGHLASFGHEVTIITRSHNGIAPAQSGVSIVEGGEKIQFTNSDRIEIQNWFFTLKLQLFC